MILKIFFKNLIKEALPYSILKILKKKFRTYNFYQNINRDLVIDKQKKVLISYITDPLDKDINNRHTNVSECNQIIKSFIDRNYCIDLIYCLDYKNIKKVLNKKYDVIFGFGEPFLQASIKNPMAKKIIYLTESYPDFSLRQETKRIEYFKQRHNQKVRIFRSNMFYKKEHLHLAECGILIGNEFTRKTFENFNKNIYTIRPTALINKNYSQILRDYHKTKKQFIWFGSYGAIHKGLDILIDAFNDLPECNLYICGLSKDEEKNISKIIKGNNIFNMGFVEVDSNRFINLVNSCSFVILPSCSEGMATSVITCMNHGLIPVVTKETGIDVYDFGIYMHSYKVEYILEILKKCSNLESELLNEMHNKVFSYTRKTFNIQVFSEDFSNILSKIL